MILAFLGLPLQKVVSCRRRDQSQTLALSCHYLQGVHLNLRNGPDNVRFICDSNMGVICMECNRQRDAMNMQGGHCFIPRTTNCNSISAYSVTKESTNKRSPPDSKSQKGLAHCAVGARPDSCTPGFPARQLQLAVHIIKDRFWTKQSIVRGLLPASVVP